MERGVMINLQQSPVVDGGLQAKSDFQTLLDDYLRLKKEVASKKRRMRNLKKKKTVLRAEVRFLRKKYEDFLKTRSSIPMMRQRNQSYIDANPYETSAPVSYPIMGNRIEGGRVEMEHVEKKRKQDHNQTQLVNRRTPKITVENQRNHGHSNAAAPVSYPIMENKIEEGGRVEMEPVERLSKKRKQDYNQTQSVNGRTPKKTVEKHINNGHTNVAAAVAPFSYPIMFPQINMIEGGRVEMEQLERLSKKRKQNYNQTPSVNGRTLKKTVEKQINHSHSNAAAALVSYPIMESSIEETERVEMERGDQIRVEKFSENNRLVVDNTEKTGKKKKRVTWKDQVVPKV